MFMDKLEKVYKNKK